MIVATSAEERISCFLNSQGLELPVLIENALGHPPENPKNKPIDNPEEHAQQYKQAQVYKQRTVRQITQPFIEHALQSLNQT